MRRLKQLTPGAQRLVDLIRQGICEPLAEMVRRVQSMNCGVGLNEKSAQLRPLDAHRPSKRGKSPEGAGSSRQLSAIAAATYFRTVALIGSASGPYSRR